MSTHGATFYLPPIVLQVSSSVRHDPVSFARIRRHALSLVPPTKMMWYGIEATKNIANTMIVEETVEARRERTRIKLTLNHSLKQTRDHWLSEISRSTFIDTSTSTHTICFRRPSKATTTYLCPLFFCLIRTSQRVDPVRKLVLFLIGSIGTCDGCNRICVSHLFFASVLLQ